MLKKAITYRDIDGKQQVEEAYFHIYSNQLAELEFEKDGGYGMFLKQMVAANNQKEVYAAFKKMISLAYGKRSATSSKFVRATPDELREFLEGPVFDALFMEIVTDEVKAVEFITGIVPQEMLQGDNVRQALVDLNLPAETFTVVDQERLFANLQPMPAVGPEVADDVPAAFRRPPVVQAKSVELPDAFKGMTRDEILAAYDKMMGSGSDDSPPAA